ncbi:unnamed protein product, partial [Porites lobata]
ILSVGVAYIIWHSLEKSQRYRHGSFVPVRNNCEAMWFIDGKDYMSVVADAIEAAEKEILITDWQINPEIFMKRPDSGVDSLEWRLDNILLRKANQGVQVCILLYWETKPFLDLGSDHAVRLLGKHRNIEIRRHPDALGGIQHPGTLFRWSHHEKMVIVDRSIAFVGDESHASESKREGSSEGKYARWIGKDYRNTFYNKESQTTWDKPFEDYEGVERNEIPRMPWHDVSCAFKGEAVQDAVRHFIDRYKGLVPWWQAFWSSFRVNFQSVVKPLPNIFPPRKSKAEEIVFTSGEHNVNIQFLRSVDKWSAGQEHEASIHNAYLDAIRNARHFIYIENQFFISSQEGFWRKVQNRIQSALVERIVRAHKARENFHVMVMTPLKPEFPGDWDSNDFNGDALRAVTFWNQATIYHGEDSLFKKLEKENIPKDIAKNYFSVYSLRKYDLIEGNFVTEIVYVHSKIMIVDDRVAIIGSANINDRSMQGERDSEVAVIIEDLDMLDGKMNGVDFKVGTFAHSLRCDLFKEHLGLLDDNEDEFEIAIRDPLANSFIKGVRERAEINTVNFLTVFGPGLFPREGIKDLEVLKRYKSIPLPRPDSHTARRLLKNIKGNLVNYPCTFLVKELKASTLDYGNMYVNRGQPPEKPRTILV